MKSLQALLLFVSLSASITIISGLNKSQPRPFWKFNRYDKHLRDVKGFEDQFWSYYSKNSMDKPSEAQGSYFRDSPKAWKYEANRTPLKIASYIQRTIQNGTNTSKSPEYVTKTEILNLSSRSKLSHGPRRRRSNVRSVQEGLKHIKKYLHVPLFCWKVLINCHRFQGHVCCPVMPDFLRPQSNEDGSGKRRSKRSLRPPYRDPLFNIPLANPYPLVIQRRQDPANPCANVDCYGNPHQKCCQIDRFFPIGPYVQTSLLENWTSALFALFGNSPVAYLLFKKALVIVLGITAFILWGVLGAQLGFIQLGESNGDKVGKRRDLLELTDKVVLAVDEGKWMKKLETLEGKAYKGIKRFICCMEPDAKDPGEGQVSCYPTKRPKSTKFGDVLECVSDLIYDISLGKQTVPKTRSDKVKFKFNPEKLVTRDRKSVV